MMQRKYSSMHSRQWAVESGQRLLCSGQLAEDSKQGQWAVDNGQ